MVLSDYCQTKIVQFMRQKAQLRKKNDNHLCRMGLRGFYPMFSPLFEPHVPSPRGGVFDRRTEPV